MYPIPASLGLDPWENYQSYGDGGYKKFVYLCRNGTDWYDGSILKADGLTIDRFCTASSFLEMGNVNAAACSFVLTEPPVDIALWAVGDEIEVQIDPDNRSTISTPSADVAKMGIFVIDSITERLGVYTIDCLDRMVYLDVEMDWTGFSTNYPITTVLSNIASQCGITLANSISGFPNATVGWYTNPTMTCRQVVSAIAEVIGANAYMDWDGELRFGWYEPAKDPNNLYVQIGENIAVSRYTAPRYYALKNYEIGSPDEPQTDVTGSDVTYRLIANPLVEGARDYINVDTIAAAITAARYTAVAGQPSYYQFNGGDYTVLPFPYIWPMDILGTQTADIPITHVTYKLNGNMILGSSVEPRVPQANTFTSPQQTIINNMQEATEEINRHFFYANATGAHITTVENDPDSGNNVLIDSNGLYIREDTDVLAEFTADGAVVGPAAAAHAEVSTSGLQIYESDGTTVIANLGYGPGKDSGGGTTNAPYYTIGTRLPGSSVGNFSVAEGRNLETTGFASHAEGDGSVASGPVSHAEGTSNASGSTSHAEGFSTASGNTSHAEGSFTNASGDYSHAQNYGTRAASFAQTAIGQYNVADSSNQYALIIGNGDINQRSNALTVDWNGDVACSGIKTNNYIRLTSANNPTYNNTYIVAVDGDANGSVMLIRPGATLIAGGGEYASNRWNVGDISVTNEQTFIGADSIVYIESNGGTIANRKTWTFYNGDITAPNGAVYEVPYKGETVTLTGANLIGNGYSGASSIYIELPLPKKIAEGSSVNLTTFTAGLRGINGTIAANGTNLLANTTAARSGAGGLRLTISGQTTNFTANTPVSAVVSNITVVIS